MVGAFQQLPQRMKDVQSKMADLRVTGTGGEGDQRVTVILSGTGEMISIELPATHRDIDREILQEHIRSATNDAAMQAKQAFAAEVKQTAEDLNLNLPGMDGLIATMSGGA